VRARTTCGAGCSTWPLTAYRQAEELVAAAEARLDALGRADARVRLLDTVPGWGRGRPRRWSRTWTTRSGSVGQAGGRRTAGWCRGSTRAGEDDRRGRITKRGPAVLRKLLVQCAWAMLRYNPWARAVFDRLSRGKARRKQAVVALARKVLVRCWAMLRDGVPWRENPGPSPAAA
jgi:transposase